MLSRHNTFLIDSDDFCVLVEVLDPDPRRAHRGHGEPALPAGLRQDPRGAVRGHHVGPVHLPKPAQGHRDRARAVGAARVLVLFCKGLS